MRKGFFVLAFALVIIATLLLLTVKHILISTRIQEASIKALELEKASFVRFQMEENIAYVIRRSLEKGLEEDIDSLLLNEIISLKIEHLMKKFSSKENVNLYITDGLNKEPLKELSKLSQTIVVKDPKTGIGLAEYTFTGGVMKNKKVVAEIKVGKALVLMEIRPGYAIKVVK